MQKSSDDSTASWERFDAHEIQPEEYADIPELDEAWFAQAVPYVGGKPVLRGRPRKENAKRKVMLRIDPDVLEGFKAHGKGWQTQMNAALRDWITRHPV